LTLAAFLLIQPGFAESLKASDWKCQEKSGWKILSTEFGRRLKGAVEFVVGSVNPSKDFKPRQHRILESPLTCAPLVTAHQQDCHAFGIKCES